MLDSKSRGESRWNLSAGFEESLEPLEVVPTDFDWKSRWLVPVRISVSYEDFSQWEFNLVA